MTELDLFVYNLIFTLFLVFLIVTTLFLIAKIWQRGVRRDNERRKTSDAG
ncbi:MAG: hypothetical protein OHK0046_32900 [Anaerolineae bacterium]